MTKPILLWQMKYSIMLNNKSLKLQNKALWIWIKSLIEVRRIQVKWIRWIILLGWRICKKVIFKMRNLFKWKILSSFQQLVVDERWSCKLMDLANSVQIEVKTMVLDMDLQSKMRNLSSLYSLADRKYFSTEFQWEVKVINLN